jgi:8-oxo-dGTP pyrophosphatase MutT (NUDIX family)
MKKLSRKKRSLANIARRISDEENRRAIRISDHSKKDAVAVAKTAEHNRENHDHGQRRAFDNSRHTDKMYSLRKVWPNERPAINEMIREATAGGVVYRITKAGNMQIILYQDARDRWTIPKGHIDEGETAQETAIREVGEEVGIHEITPVCWLGKVHFRYRRENTLVLMTTQIYLFRADKWDEKIEPEEWMQGARWFDFDEAIDKIAYEDIGKLVLLARRRLRERGEIA